MSYQIKTGHPTAHITKRKSRLKIYNGHIVFLENKDNFEFELYNPTRKSVLCKIKLNGQYISTNGLVLRPGERVFLERFLDTNNKFEYGTYEVKDNQKNRDAIENNGDVLIEFYDESDPYPNFRINSSYSSTGINLLNYSTGSSTGFGSTATGISTATMTTPNSNITFTNSIGTTALYSNKIETGRVERGSESKQNFTHVNESFNYFTSHVINYKILPLSRKLVTKDDIRHYCTECGTQIKKNYKFCPSCGTKV